MKYIYILLVKPINISNKHRKRELFDWNIIPHIGYTWYFFWDILIFDKKKIVPILQTGTHAYGAFSEQKYLNRRCLQSNDAHQETLYHLISNPSLT